MALFSRKKKTKVRETDDKNSILRSLQETPVNDTIQTKKKQVIIKTHIQAAITRIIAFVLVVVFIFTCIFGIRTIESNDMYPSIRAGDLIIYFRLIPPKRMDAVLYKNNEGKVNIGRIQAVEDDVIDKTNAGQLTINGNIQPVQKKQGLFYKTYIREGGTKLPVTIKHKEYFVLGDERDSAKDSRIYGPIKDRDIIGKIFTVVRRRAV